MTTFDDNCCPSTSLNVHQPLSLRVMFTRAYDLWRSRRALAGLTSAQLEDVGVTPREAKIEARRAVWDVPYNWHD